MKIYTRGGDQGMTSLFGGQRVSKDDLRVEAYGTLDEANSLLGVVLSFCGDKEIMELIVDLQNQLFLVSAELANPKATPNDRLSEMIKYLEEQIDHYDNEIPPLKQFVLPGGNHPAAFLHLTRTVVRRAERRVATLLQREAVPENILVYLNRLSDLLFVMARVVNTRYGKEISFGGNEA